MLKNQLEREREVDRVVRNLKSLKQRKDLLLYISAGRWSSLRN